MAEAIGVASGIVGLAGFALQSVQQLASFIDGIKGVAAGLSSVQNDLGALTAILDGLVVRLGYGASLHDAGLTQALQSCRANCDEFRDKLMDWTKHSTSHRVAMRDKFRLGWLNKSAVDDFRSQLLQSKATLGLALSSIVVSDGSDDLDKLPVALQAAFNASSRQDDCDCLEGTRVDVMNDIDKWILADDQPCLFWLNGIAGTGKSTIARTICRRLHKAPEKYLGASFFFSRGQDTSSASQFITTIAKQLALSQPSPLRQKICDAIKANPEIASIARQEQWKALVLDPLSQCYAGGTRRTIIIVVDALDECTSEADVRNIIPLLASMEAIKSAKMRVFVTSRPEVPIRLSFRQSSILYRDLILHDRPKAVLDADIRLFFKHELSRIKAERSEFEHVNASWPSAADIERLVDLSSGLFIYAATVCRWIEENQNSSLPEALRVLIDHPNLSNDYIPDPSKTWYLDQLYLQILDHAVPAYLRLSPREKFLSSARRFLGCLILLRESIPLSALADFLETTTDEIRRWVQNFHSVIRVPAQGGEEDPLQFYHASFREFLLDKSRCQDSAFWIQAEIYHEELARRSLRTLSEPTKLNRDLCKLGKPDVWREDITIQYIAAHIGSDVAYACGNWVYHTSQSGKELQDNGREHVFLREKLLFWLEALAWTGRLSEGITQIKSLLSTIRGDQGPDVSQLLHDAWRFTLHNRFMIDTWPLQIYVSALVFSPSNSIVRKTYGCFMPEWITELPQVPLDWSAELMQLVGHSEDIVGICFSPIGNYLASASRRTVRIWNVEHGTEEHRFEPFSSQGRVELIRFCPAGNIIIVSSTGKVSIWNLLSGEEIQRFGSYPIPFSASVLSCSPDGKLLLFAPPYWQEDSTFIVRSVVDGKELHQFRGSKGILCDSGCFSADGRFIVSTSEDQTLKVWSAATWESLPTLTSDDKVTACLSFVDEWLASRCADGTMRVWDLKDAEEVQIKGYHNWGAICLSSDHQLISRCKEGNTITIWNADTGTQLQKLSCHAGPQDLLVFSPDNKLLASASFSKSEIRVWDVRDKIESPKYEGHQDRISSICFSPDGTLLATSSFDRTIKLWNAATKEELRTLVGHEHVVLSVCFSPQGDRMLSVSDRTIRVWDTATGKTLPIIDDPKTEKWWACFSHDGTLIASCSPLGLVSIWDVSSGEELQEPFRDYGIAWSACFSPDDTLVASNFNNAVIVWDIKSGKKLHKITGKGCPAERVSPCFSPDGQLFASIWEDTPNSLRVWSLDDGKECARFGFAGTHLSPITFTSDGHQIRNNCGETFPLDNYNDLNGGNAITAKTTTTGTLSVVGDWIRRGKGECLYIPPDYRWAPEAPCAVLVQGNTVTIGRSSGSLMFLSFTE